MQDISELLKEAKPLYLARKKRHNRIKAGVVMLTCAMFVIAFLPQKQSTEGLVYWDLGYTGTESETYVENLGLPVDDYGLLLVS